MILLMREVKTGCTYVEKYDCASYELSIILFSMKFIYSKSVI